jgi:predicted nucleotidyltransferase
MTGLVKNADDGRATTEQGGLAARAWSTGHAQVDAVLELLLAEVRDALGQQFVGMVVHGSLAAGGFEPGRSDVDVVVVTEGELDAGQLAAVQAAHERLQERGLYWMTRLEVSYIPRDALRRYDPENAVYPALRMDGSFDLDEHGPDWVLQRHVIRERGLVLAGPEPRTLVDAVPPDQIRWAARETLRAWWAPQLVDDHRLRSDEYQAYAVLTMCRALYTVHQADVAPKAVAARWAREQVGARWGSLIDRAMAWRHGDVLDALDEVLALIRYTLEQAEG